MLESEIEESSSPLPLNLWEMTAVFLKLGSIGFGGGIAMIALMENEFVKRRRLLAIDEFLHGVALSQILGSFPVNTALFIGYRLHGFWGGLLGSLTFLLPSVVAVILLSWLYFGFHTIPSLQGALAGLTPVVIGIILAAVWSMGQKSVRSTVTIAIAIAACLGSLTHINPLLILGSGGIIGLILQLSPPTKTTKLQTSQKSALVGLPLALQTLPHQAAQMATASSQPVQWLTLVLTFLKVGIVFFGGGFVLIPVLKQLLIDQLHWLTQQEFIDGVAISQLTPGPIAVIATFAGFRVAGIGGAFLATVALFLPSLLLMFALAHYYQVVKHLQRVKQFLAGVNPAVVGMVLSAAINLAPAIVHLDQPVSLILNSVLLVFSLVAITRLKWHPAIALAVGATVGLCGGQWLTGTA
ncbi:chromate efflux transporter [Thermosynechococcus sp. QS41]|uniref:chromate efflux transporter n=1 Tax=Thermosynechococcus sp. QS41 TaxID=3074101 RepID=UPI002877C267|nr:chromate efflux transporter [Thermosynechococcus sp. QS41]WNC59891.1 chromate efflux transporter [Thermosynechococcus sp. QS41]